MAAGFFPLDGRWVHLHVSSCLCNTLKSRTCRNSRAASCRADWLKRTLHISFVSVSRRCSRQCRFAPFQLIPRVRSVLRPPSARRRLRFHWMSAPHAEVTFQVVATSFQTFWGNIFKRDPSGQAWSHTWNIKGTSTFLHSVCVCAVKHLSLF